MNCQDCESRLSDYIERALAKDAGGAMDLHFATCESCRELLAAMRSVMDAGASFPVYDPPPWLATRILANTPQTRISLRGVLADTWRALGEPRVALAIFTATVVIGWFGGAAARESITDRAESVMSCVYDKAVRSYYRSPVIIEIQSQIQSRFDRLMENS